MKSYNFIAILVLFWGSPVSPARIMMLTIIGTTSTTNSFQFLADELVKRGHEIIFVCHTKVVDGPRPNITYIQLPAQLNSSFATQAFTHHLLNFFPLTHLYVIDILTEYCRMNVQSKEILEVRDYANVDLVIFDMFLQECFLPLVHAKNVPIAMYHGNTPELSTAHALQLPIPCSYVTTFDYQPLVPMTFTNRLWNTLLQTVSLLLNRWIYYPQLEKLNQQLLPYVPHIEDIMMNISIVMPSIESAWNPARPLMPFIFDITCAHCRPAKRLPKDIQNAVDQAEDGFIIFAMGTFFQSEFFPHNYLEVFLTVFSKLTKYVIIWKRDAFENQPANVKTFPWLPQQDLLGHPKARLFISHGGMYSIHEAIYHGLPILGIGIFGDQDDNIRRAVDKGIAVSINRMNITTEYLHNAITDMLTNPRYGIQTKKLSVLMRDQPETPLERAVYATEFLLKHRADPFILQGRNNDMTFVTYFSLDILGCILLLIFIPTVIVVHISRKLISRVTRKK